MLNGYQRHKRSLQKSKTTCTEGENSQAYSRVLTNLNDCFVTIKTTPRVAEYQSFGGLKTALISRLRVR